MPSPNISFDSIPSSIRKPGAYTEFNTKLAVRTLPSNSPRLLLIGQRTNAGTVAEKAVVPVFSDTEASTFFGAGSNLALMVQAAIKANPLVAIDAVGVNDAAASTAASATIDFAGGVSSGGSVLVSLAGKTVEIGLTTEAYSAIPGLIKSAIDNRGDWPVTCAVTDPSAGVKRLTLTCRNAGTLGNDLALDVQLKTTGPTLSFTQMTGGAADPDITGLLADLLPLTNYVIVLGMGNTSALMSWLKAHVDARSSPTEQRRCIAVFGQRSTLSTATTFAGVGNHGRLTLASCPGSPTPGAIIGAVYAAVIASEEDPARPLNTLPMPGVVAPNPAKRLLRSEQETMLNNGVTPLVVGPDGQTVQIVRAVTTYTTNPAGITDISLLDLTTIRTLDYASRAWRDRIALRFPRDKKTPEVKRQVRSELLDVAYKLEELGIIEAVDANKAGFIVEDDSQDPNRLNARIPCDVVNGLHVFAARIDLLL